MILNVKNFLKQEIEKKDDGDKLRVIFSFYMSTVVGALEFGGATENFIAAILPHISTFFCNSFSKQPLLLAKHEIIHNSMKNL